jgi:hypothetical protein
MKINYKNTALSFLEDPYNFSMHTPDEYQKPMSKAEDLKLLHGLQAQFSEPGFADLFKKKVQYITQPFYESYWRGRDKLREIALDTEFDDAGTFIIPWKTHTKTFFYMLRTNGKKEDWDFEVMIIMFTKAPSSESFGLDLCVYLGKKERMSMDVVWKGFTKEGRDITWWVSDLILMKCFLKFADVESKIVKGNKKEKHLGNKYVNETKRNVEILDSTYFTNIIREEGFGVRGHWRLQPVGSGRIDKRLTWVHDYQKHGYIRRAKISTGNE